MTGPELGVCLAAFADRSFEDALDAVARLELSVVDLPTDSVFAVSRCRPSDHEVRRHLDDLGIRVGCVSNSRDTQLLLGPHGRHTDAVAGGGAAAKADHARRAAVEAITLAASLGAPLVRLMLGCPDHARWLRWSGSDVSWDDNVAAFVEVAVPLARLAREHGVQLCIEPHVKQVAFDAPSTRACLDGIRGSGEDVALCFDPANLAAIGFDPVEVLSAIAAVPACVHAKDLERSTSAAPPPGRGWVRYGPQPAIRFRSVPWGVLDWPGILTHLHEIGFDGPILVEHEDLLTDPEVGIDGARRFLAAHRMGAPRRDPWW